MVLERIKQSTPGQPTFRLRTMGTPRPNHLPAGPLKASLVRAPALMRFDASLNALSGDMTAFASALAAASSNALVEFNVSRNQLSGAVPPGLARLAVFDARPVKSPDGCAAGGQ